MMALARATTSGLMASAAAGVGADSLDVEEGWRVVLGGKLPTRGGLVILDSYP